MAWNLTLTATAILIGSVGTISGTIVASGLVEKLNQIQKKRQPGGPLTEEVMLKHDLRGAIAYFRKNAAQQLLPEENTQALARMINLRMNEARELQKTKHDHASRARFLAISLIVGEYILGGVLASTFIQHSVSQHIAGILGVFVLLSTLVRQRFNPEVTASNSRIQSAKLKAFIRATEDKLTTIRLTTTRGEERLDAELSILTSVSSFLAAIENMNDGADGSLSITPSA